MIVRDCNEVTFSSFYPAHLAKMTSLPGRFLKPNFNGSAIGNPELAGTGVVICDNASSHILSFSGPVGFGSVNEVEMHALRTGLQEVFRRILLQIIFEGDSGCLSLPSNGFWDLLSPLEVNSCGDRSGTLLDC